MQLIEPAMVCKIEPLLPASIAIHLAHPMCFRFRYTYSIYIVNKCMCVFVIIFDPVDDIHSLAASFLII